MHGIIHSELKQFVESRHGADAWQAILDKSGLAGKTYLVIGTYPDQEVNDIVAAAAAITGTPRERILEDFGEHLAPKLAAMYRALIRPQWRTLELLLNTEATIHRVVRIQNKGAEPPRLRFEQVGPDELVLHYDSPRRLAAVARGIMKGMAALYQQKLLIQERTVAGGGTEMRIKIEG